MNSLLLVVAVLLGGSLEFEQKEVASYCAAIACGLQNGMCTMHFGAVVRTTHVTGLGTDLGSTLGRAFSILWKKRFRYSRLDEIDLAELHIDYQKLTVFLSVYSGFVAGSIFGAFMENFLGVLTLLIPASITGLGGLAYTFFQERLKSWFRAAEVSNLNEILERTRGFLRIWQEASASTADDKGEEDEDVDDHISHTLEVLQDLEASLEHLCEEKYNYNWHSPKSNRSDASKVARARLREERKAKIRAEIEKMDLAEIEALRQQKAQVKVAAAAASAEKRSYISAKIRAEIEKMDPVEIEALRQQRAQGKVAAAAASAEKHSFISSNNEASDLEV